MAMSTKVETIENLMIKKIAKNELHIFQSLINLFEEVFKMKDFKCPPEQHLQKLLNKNNFTSFVAMIEGEVVGGLTTYVLDQYYNVKPQAYLYDLAVLAPWQRKGIATELIHTTKHYYSSLNFEEVFVQADKMDAHALSFYKATGGLEENVSHFTYKL